MNEKVMIYCDESCHIEHDGNDLMTLAAIYVRKNDVKFINKKINEIVSFYGYNPNAELKWTKISNTNLKMYIKLIDYISENINQNMRLRVIVAKNKRNLSLDDYSITYDQWYHAMYYRLLEVPIDHISRHNLIHLLIDKKDNHSQCNINKVAEYLTKYSKFEKKIFATAEDSKFHRLIQIADIFAGASAYKNRGLKSSEAKIKIIKYIEQKLDFNLSRTTIRGREDVNLFVWGE